MDIRKTLDRIAPESEAVDLSDLSTYALGYLDAESKYLRMIEAGELVKVVRCKDCRRGREVCGNIECFVDSNIPTEYHGYEWFCPNGERRTDEETIHQYHERHKEVLKEMSMPVGRNVMDALREMRTDETD